ncbi:MAG: hypothetical protein A2Z99_15915 [Treponema sp. GWB1_62_6]|nr:MAG: hypothetical protein A2Y36_07370 [Treponema sp. GWA1_62_8]OHE66069.1 MAG: hypothetical protein A2001_20120 [Treponema sp. GWC1_61_84]OHE71005.1 MAG: hypothetical protein A2Z99_15915 [Treponema sp. GWB1_62_6]OHE74202.1 MAG: hypothetical protein A2413_18785 [Treponema sp. RIFOXYC1_FULL_61_9]
MCVDDEAIITMSLKRELQMGFPAIRVESAISGPEALEVMDDIIAAGGAVAVLVTDERMPGMAGHILLREARKRVPGVYGILLTGYTDVEALAEAVNEAGLFRYIHKPWDRTDLAMAVGRALDLYDREREVADLHLRVEQLNLAIVSALENSAHEDDPDTYGHVQRVACYSGLLARGLGQSESDCRRLFLYAPLHDIGKSGIPHMILSKPGSLSVEEFDIVKRHVSIGARLLKSMEVDTMAKDLILYHHERWDGKGYMAELSGEAIPLSARIVSLADVLDAMLCERPYKRPIPFDQVSEEILSMAGSRFDPAIVKAFEANIDSFRQVAAGNMRSAYAEFRDNA